MAKSPVNGFKKGQKKPEGSGRKARDRVKANGASPELRDLRMSVGPTARRKRCSVAAVRSGTRPPPRQAPPTVASHATTVGHRSIGGRDPWQDA